MEPIVRGPSDGIAAEGCARLYVGAHDLPRACQKLRGRHQPPATKKPHEKRGVWWRAMQGSKLHHATLRSSAKVQKSPGNPALAPISRRAKTSQIQPIPTTTVPFVPWGRQKSGRELQSRVWSLQRPAPSSSSSSASRAEWTRFGRESGI